MLEALSGLVGTKWEEGREHWRKLHTGASWFIFITKYYSDDKTWKHEMGWACGTYGTDDKYTRDIGNET
jgi:hypothetical protein